jgi:DNA-binding transcriptional LysR family regulator
MGISNWRSLHWLIAERIWNDPLDFVVAPDHPLAHSSPLTLSRLCEYPAVFPGANTFTRGIVSQLFSQAGLQPHISMSTNYMETIKMMVSIGLAWSVLPRTMVDWQVKALTLHDASLERQLGVIWHSGRTLSNAGHAFIRLLKDNAKGSGLLLSPAQTIV